jgi:nucleoside-diphosphate-sugar epimerase
VSDDRYLVTGALGCLGAWTVRALVREGADVTTFDLGTDQRRLRQLLDDVGLARVRTITGDLTDPGAVRAAVDEHGIDHVIHLAALQVPFCRADPVAGDLVNVVGTVNVFDAVKAARAGGRTMAPIVFTSSMGMYGPDDPDPVTGVLAEDAPAHSTNHYGVYKQANEGNARVYWLDDGLASIGVRPLTVYGVGRDQGMTSGPTKAIVAAVLGRSYTIPFGGATRFQYAADVAATLVAASRSGFAGAAVYNLPGVLVDGDGVVAAIEAAVPGAAARLAYERVSLPFPPDIEDAGIAALGPLPLTPFVEGVRESVAIYRALQAEGRLDPVAQGLEPAS